MIWTRRAIASWEEQGVPLLPPVGEGEILAVLQRLARPFSKDVVALYRIVGGMDDHFDKFAFCLWPVRHLEIRNLNEDGADIAFGDFLIDSFQFYFHFEEVARSSVYGGYERRKMADSVEEFFERYCTEPGHLDLMT